MIDREQGIARADFCRFLAACYYEPGPEFSEERLFDSMRAAAGQIDPELEANAMRLGKAYAFANVEELLVEYTRLFLGPGDAPARPYGSLWLETGKSLMQDSTMAVQELYRAGGFELSDDFKELPDHIAAELEFLYVLLFHESRKGGAGTGEDPIDPGILRRKLLSEHVGRWVGPFTDALRAAAKVDFYRELADVTRRFVLAEASRAKQL
jgi:TorA maturation chaperone TorD